MKVFPAVSATFLLFALQILGIANQVYSISITKGNNDNGSSIKPASSTKKKFQCNTRGYDASKELAFQKKLIALKQSKHHMEDFDDADLTPEVGGMVGSTSSTPRIDTRRHSTGSHSLLFVKRSPMAPLQPPALMLPPTRESHTPPVVRSTARTRQRTQTVRNVVQIDVFFHIFTFEGHGGVSNEVIETQLHFLNSAYAVAKFHFINRGVDHHEIHNEHEFLIGPSSQTKSRLRRGGHNALNVYVAGLDEAILGYSSMLLDDIVSSGAKDDGIVISTATLPGGSLDDFNLGTTLIHET